MNFTLSSLRPRLDATLRSLVGGLGRSLRALGLAIGLSGLLVVGGVAPAHADSPALGEALRQEVLQLVRARVEGPSTPRVEVTLGQLDPRLRLATCERVEPYIPQGTRLWGRARVGLRCAQGPTHWNVYLPVTVDVFGPGFVAARPLAAGHVITQADLRPAEINLGAHRSPAVSEAAVAVGRTLAQALPAGESLRQSALRSRQWFAPGDTVKVRAVGDGFAITGSGQALAAGLEGQTVRIRTDSGKVVTGQPVDEGVVEITL